MEAQNEGPSYRQRRVGCCGSWYYPYGYVNKSLNEVGKEGNEYNPVVSFKFNVIECHNQGVMG